MTRLQKSDHWWNNYALSYVLLVVHATHPDDVSGFLNAVSLGVTHMVATPLMICTIACHHALGPAIGKSRGIGAFSLYCAPCAPFSFLG
jgi:hypothetical protein